MSDETIAKNTCEQIKEILDNLPPEKWKDYHHKAAKLLGYERKEAE